MFTTGIYFHRLAIMLSKRWIEICENIYYMLELTVFVLKWSRLVLVNLIKLKIDDIFFFGYIIPSCWFLNARILCKNTKFIERFSQTKFYLQYKKKKIAIFQTIATIFFEIQYYFLKQKIKCLFPSWKCVNFSENLSINWRKNWAAIQKK